MFPIRNGLIKRDAFWPLLFNFVFDYVIGGGGGSLQPGCLEIKWYTSYLVYANDVNILDGRVRTIKKNTGALVVTSKETGLEVNADKSK
jgi:hypothetical protein